MKRRRLTAGSAPVLADMLGPRGRRRVLVASIVAGAVIVLFIIGALNRLDDKGQLDESRWEPLTQWAVIKFYLGGLANTIKVAVASMGAALAVGGLMALGRLARNRPTGWLAGIYVEFFRAMPLYLLILFSLLALPRLGLNLSTFWSLALALAVYNSSILAEIVRSGILSLDKGQGEAASSIGLSYWQSMGLVIVPQAVRRMVPAIVSQLVTLLKDTSLGVLLGFEELLRRAEINYEFFHNPVQSVALAALMYIAVNATLSQIATRLEARQRRRYQAGSIQVAGVEDLAVVQAKANVTMGQAGLGMGGGGAV
jgi:glutamate transport system permease protein